jgi:hypothetical protein
MRLLGGEIDADDRPGQIEPFASTARRKRDMAIKVGDTLPLDVTLMEMGDGGPQGIAVKDLVKGKKVVIFAVPGAFTPTCSMKHLPGFVEQAAAI